MAKTRSERRGILASPDRAGQWAKVARNWKLLGPPLRPSPEDVRFSEEAVGAWRGRGAPPRVLLLGVTPELYGLPWPSGTDFLAVDRTMEAIEAVWPGPREAVRCEDWLEMKLPAASRDIVLCDGGLNLLAYPKEQRQLASNLRGVLAEGGLCILRLFVRPAERETRDAVLADLMGGRIPNMNVLKLRLWMALQESPSQGVELDTVWRAVQGAAGNLEVLASKVGWPLEETLTINAYRGSTTRYWLGTVDEVAEIFCHEVGGFELASMNVPSYEGGRQCPTVVLRRTSSAGGAGQTLGDLLNGYQNTALLYVAAKLGLADLLAKGAKTSTELAAMTGAHPPSLYRILRGLVIVGMCFEEEERFWLTRLGEVLLTGVDGSLRNQALVCGEQYMGAWSDLVHSVMTGETAFAHVFGVDQWEHRQRNMALSERFNANLNTETARSAVAIVEAYDFSAYGVLCDVGGGHGALLCTILAACPTMRGILLEQAHVATGAVSYVESQDLDERCRVIEGDFFEAVPEGADAYVMKSIMHDWPDARSVAILKNCRRALRSDGRVILVERVMPALAKDAPDTVRVDLHMLAVTGGRERSEAEYQGLLEAAGFRLGRIVATRSPFCVIEGVPR